LNNEGTEVANGLPKSDEGSLNRTNGLYFFFLNENRMHPPSGSHFQKIKPDGLVIWLERGGVLL